MEWVKQLPNWVKGGIAFLTAVIGFVILIRTNLYLSVTVLVASALIASFFLSLYLAFSIKQIKKGGSKTAYRFPQYRLAALVTLVVVPIISTILITNKETRAFALLAWSGRPPIALISETYQKDTMSYDLIVQNNSATTQVLDTIGVESDVSGDFNCASGGGPLLSSGHYIARFHVADPEVKETMDPPLSIPPNDVVRFSVSLVPDAIGACSQWSGSFVLFVENTSGARVQTESQAIDSSNIGALSSISYSLDQLIEIANNSPDETSRASAIRQISGNGIGLTTPPPNIDEADKLYMLFSHALQEDPDPWVQSEAMIGLGWLGNQDAVPAIIPFLQSDQDVSLRSAAAKALGRLGDSRAIEPLGLALLNDPENDVQFFAATSLGAIGDSEAETYLLQAWTDKTPANVVSQIAWSLINLQSTEAIPQILAGIKEGDDVEQRASMIRNLRGSDPSYMAAFIPTLIDLLAHAPEEHLRASIAIELRFFPNQPEVIAALGQCAVTDPSSQVQLYCVESLSEIGNSAAIEQLKNIAAVQTGDVKQAAEDALKTLEQ